MRQTLLFLVLLLLLVLVLLGLLLVQDSQDGTEWGSENTDRA